MAKSNAKETVAKKSRNREILGILIICFSVFVFLALMFHSEGDWPGSSKGFGEPSQNITGRYGAFMSHLIFQYIGYTGYFLASFFLVSGLIIFLHKSLVQLIKPLIFISVLGVFLPLLTSLVFGIGSDSTVPGSETSYGGVLGVMLAYVFVTYLGRAGAVLITLAVVLVAVVISTNIKPSTMAEHLLTLLHMAYEWIKTLIPKPSPSRKKPREKKTAKSRHAPVDSEQDYIDQEDVTPFLTDPEQSDDASAVKPYIEPKITMPELTEIPLPDTDVIVDQPNDSDGMIEDGMIDGDIPDDEIVDNDALQDNDDEPVETLIVEEYYLPGMDLLDEPLHDQPQETREEMLEKSRRLVESLRHFNVEAEVRQITPGPIVTRYELTLAPGIKVGKVVNLSDDLQLTLKAKGGIRILAPIPGKAAIGIEVPNRNRSMVYFREITESEAFSVADKPLVLALGKNTAGEPIVADLAKMPHLLIAGSTGSGKSVCINTIISSILMKATPDLVRMIMIDPKVVELSIYKAIPHLLTPVISDPKQAANALQWAVSEMETRYRQLASFGVRDLVQFNDKMAEKAKEWEGRDNPPEIPGPLPYIVIIIDEFADLMVVASNDVEESIARLAQMARAVGIHLVLATQRPSSDVITGLIKANFPSRIAFKVMQASNSRIILDQNGADKLLGMGDMLFLQVGKPEPIRLHGAFISNDESTRLADCASKQTVPGLNTITEDIVDDDANDDEIDNVLGLRDPTARDALFFKAARLVVRTNQGSVSLLQRRLKIGYARAARVIDQLELASIVSPYDGSKARDVLVDDLYIDDLEAGEI